MEYSAKNFESLLGTAGFSDDLLKNHFKLYEGYVANTNKAVGLKRSLEAGTPEFAEVNRRFGWEFNGMRLHELYFGNMTKDEGVMDAESGLAKQMADEFGTVEEWEKDFRATGGSRGIGWVVLYFDKEAGRLFNVWINEHDLGHLAGGTPLLVMDVFEHAFMLDYGLAKGEYIDAFMKAVDWGVVKDRFES